MRCQRGCEALGTNDFERTSVARCFPQCECVIGDKITVNEVTAACSGFIDTDFFASLMKCGGDSSGDAGFADARIGANNEQAGTGISSAHLLEQEVTEETEEFEQK